MAPSLLRPSEGTVAEDWLSTPSWIEGASGAFDRRGRQPGRQGAFDAQGGGHVPMSPLNTPLLELMNWSMLKLYQWNEVRKNAAVHILLI